MGNVRIRWSAQLISVTSKSMWSEIIPTVTEPELIRYFFQLVNPVFNAVSRYYHSYLRLVNVDLLHCFITPSSLWSPACRSVLSHFSWRRDPGQKDIMGYGQGCSAHTIYFWRAFVTFRLLHNLTTTIKLKSARSVYSWRFPGEA